MKRTLDEIDAAREAHSSLTVEENALLTRAFAVIWEAALPNQTPGNEGAEKFVNAMAEFGEALVTVIIATRDPKATYTPAPPIPHRERSASEKAEEDARRAEIRKQLFT